MHHPPPPQPKSSPSQSYSTLPTEDPGRLSVPFNLRDSLPYPLPSSDTTSCPNTPPYKGQYSAPGPGQLTPKATELSSYAKHPPAAVDHTLAELVPGHPILPVESSYDNNWWYKTWEKKWKIKSPRPAHKTVKADEDYRLSNPELGPQITKYNLEMDRSLDLYLFTQLEVTALDKMHKHLWWAGRPGTHRALHKQKLMARKIHPVEHAHLHLIWVDSIIYLKPLPPWLLNYEFWRDVLCRKDAEEVVEKDKEENEDPGHEMHKLAAGFLRSWTKLIQSKLDFKVAREEDLIPDDLTWEKWSRISTAVIEWDAKEKKGHVNRRYIYGELRLRRLNQIQRYVFRNVMRMYYSVYVTYNQFFGKNFAGVVVVMVYLGVVVQAMQMVLQIEAGGGAGGDESGLVTPAFRIVCYWFGVLSIIGIVGAGGLALLIFCVLFLYHLICTIINLQKRNIIWVGKPMVDWLTGKKNRSQRRDEEEEGRGMKLGQEPSNHLKSRP